jgi:hypothetical protein
VSGMEARQGENPARRGFSEADSPIPEGETPTQQTVFIYRQDSNSDADSEIETASSHARPDVDQVWWFSHATSTSDCRKLDDFACLCLRVENSDPKRGKTLLQLLCSCPGSQSSTARTSPAKCHGGGGTKAAVPSGDRGPVKPFSIPVSYVLP